MPPQDPGSDMAVVARNGSHVVRKYRELKVDGRMHAWMDSCMDGWMNRLMNG